MPSLTRDSTVLDYQKFVKEVYGLPNDRHFGTWELFSNVERFTMRGLKGIRKVDKIKAKTNLMIALSWFVSLVNRLHINLEEEIWKRFPYACSYCGACPCSCKENKFEFRQRVFTDETKRPKILSEFEIMFNKIYPAEKRTIEHAGVHLAEELGELSEAILAYRGTHREDDFQNVMIETADFFSCMIGVFNSLEINVAEELATLFSFNCHVCKKVPCECNFVSVAEFQS